MSSSDSQPPLTRRQARERERASETGAVPVVPPASVPAGVSAPASATVGGAAGAGSAGAGARTGSAGPSTADSSAAAPSAPSPIENAPVGNAAPRRRPGSHAAPSIAPAAQAPAPAPSAPSAPAPASASQPSGRRAAAQAPQQPAPQQPAPQQPAPQQHAPQAPVPQPAPPRPTAAVPSDTRPTALPEVPAQTGPALPGARVDEIPASAMEVPGTGMTRRELRALREAQLQQQSNPVPLQAPTPQSSDRTVADVLGTVAEIEHDRGIVEQVESAPIEPAQLEQATVADGSPDAIEPLAEAAAHAEEPRLHRSTWAPSAQDDAEPTAPAPVADPAPSVAGVPVSDPLARAARSIPSATTPSVFPLDLDEDPVEDDVDDRVPGSDRSAVPDAAAADGIDSAVAGEGRGTPATEPPEQGGHDGASADAVAPAPAPAAAPAPAPIARPNSAPPTVPYEPPVGHWSRQADAPDDQLHDPETGVVRITDTSANSIIMPNSALSDVTGALNATGEVIITGSIDLPKTLAATGAHTPHIDGVEVDRLLEQHDGEAPASDATPVRASRAVSSHTSTRAVVLAASRPKESRWPLALSVGAATVGVAGVAAIVVAAFALHVI